jgi:hypothetical protein
MASFPQDDDDDDDDDNDNNNNAGQDVITHEVCRPNTTTLHIR